MFKFLRKKTQVEALIAADGIDHVVDRFTEIIARKLTGRELAYQFILQELDGAHLGNAESQLFAKNSGIHEVEYRAALHKSIPEVDGAEGPQQLLLALSLQITDPDQMADFRCRIDDRVMRMFKLGKYGEKHDHIERLLASLKNILLDDKDVIPAFTPNVPVHRRVVGHAHHGQRGGAHQLLVQGHFTKWVVQRPDALLLAQVHVVLDDVHLRRLEHEAALHQRLCFGQAFQAFQQARAVVQRMQMQVKICG